MEVWELVGCYGNFQSLMFGVGGRSRGDCGSEWFLHPVCRLSRFFLPSFSSSRFNFVFGFLLL